jgi:hypothetical protein
MPCPSHLGKKMRIDEELLASPLRSLISMFLAVPFILIPSYFVQFPSRLRRLVMAMLVNGDWVNIMNDE